MPMPHLIAHPDGTTVNPVVIPKPGRENVSALEAGTRDGKARNPAGPSFARTVTRRRLMFTPGQAPALAPVGHEDRPAYAPGAATDNADHGATQWGQTSPGTHGELSPLASTPSGDQVPFSRQGNTWRLAPQPWDADVYVTPKPAGA